MKTPMQEFIDWLNIYSDNVIDKSMVIYKAELMLEKEKEAIMNAYDIGWSDGNKGQDLNDLYYNETFNTK